MPNYTQNFWNDTININEAKPIEIFIIDLTQLASSNMIIYGSNTENTDGTPIGPIFDNPTNTTGNNVPLEGTITAPTTIPNLGMRLSGLKYDLTGSIPEPTLTIDKQRLATDANYTAALSYWNTTLSQLGEPFPWTGGIVVRLRTNAIYQDATNIAAHPEYWAKKDKFVIKEVAENSESILELVLTPALGISVDDQSGRVLSDNLCSLRYRTPDPTTPNTFFQYPLSEGGCPYAGSNYWNSNGFTQTSWVNDQCGKTIDQCLLRFGSGTIPFTGKA